MQRECAHWCKMCIFLLDADKVQKKLTFEMTAKSDSVVMSICRENARRAVPIKYLFLGSSGHIIHAYTYATLLERPREVQQHHRTCHIIRVSFFLGGAPACM